MATDPLLAARMRSLLLQADTRLASPLEVVRWMGALQAQDYESGLWAVGLRTAGCTRAAVEQAIAQREIVRTWSMRGTWHFVPAVDVRWMQDLMAVRQVPAIRKRSADLGFDEKTVARARRLVVRALEGGRILPRTELVRRLAAAGLRTDDQGGNHLLRRFGNEGLLCTARPEGKDPTFVLRDEWVARPVALAGEAALAELARRYFRSHGPATERDLAWWSGLTLGDVRTAIAAAAPALARRTAGDHEYWMAGDAAPPPAPAAAELLPAFDEHLLGYADRSAVLDADFASAICPGGNGVFRPTLVLRGRVGGVWKRKETARQLVLEITPRAALTVPSRRALDHVAARLGEFHGKPAVVRLA